MRIKGIPMPGKESPQRAVDDKRDNSRVQPSGRGKAGYGGYSEGGENPRAGSGMDGGKYSQPQLKGAAKASQRVSEHNYTMSNAQRGPSSKQHPYEATPKAGRTPPGGARTAKINVGTTPRAGGESPNSDQHRGKAPPQYTPTPVAGKVPPRGNNGDMRSGMDKALSDHADALHPVKRGSLGAKGKPSPHLMQ
jgi:hypothetical protein